MVTGRTGIVKAPTAVPASPTGRCTRSVSWYEFASACTVQLVISRSQMPTARVFWPAGADTVTPSAVTVHGEVALATVNRSRTGASGTCGAGTVVIVRCHLLLIVAQIRTSPW